MIRFEESIAYEHREKIAKAYERGVSQVKLAKQYSTHHQAIRKAIIIVLGIQRFRELVRRNKDICRKGTTIVETLEGEKRKRFRIKIALTTEDEGFDVEQVRNRPSVFNINDPMFFVNSCLSARLRIW